jgi:hypothetical protein
MSWKFTRPNDWNELTASVLPDEIPPKKTLKLYMLSVGYSLVTNKMEGYDRKLGNWVLFANKRAAVGLPHYVLYVDDGSSACEEVWVPTFADLMEYMRLYNPVGK